jgi:hypothetical protein
MVLAAGFWAGVLVLLARFPAVPPVTVLSAAGFLAFFLGYVAHYEGAAVQVTGDGLVFHGLFRSFRVSWDDVVRVEVRSGAAGTLYAVVTRRGSVRFTSLLARHRELFHLLLAGARLAAEG